MKQAILILGYQDINNIIRIIHYFDDCFEFYIHIDKKSKADLSRLYTIKNKSINIYRKYVVNWGGIFFMKVALFLVKKALENDSNKYFHLISEQDFPIKPLHYFYDLAKENKNYLVFEKLPKKVWDGNGGLDRIHYYHFNDFFNARKYGRGKLLKLLIHLQKTLKIKRSYGEHLPQLYGGSMWWSLTREVLQYVIKESENNSFLKNRLNYTLLPDEIYFQTILVNSPYLKNIINDNLRYIDWTYRGGSRPAFLDMSDYNKLITSNKIFARKFNENSQVLINKLNEIIKYEKNFIN